MPGLGAGSGSPRGTGPPSLCRLGCCPAGRRCGWCLAPGCKHRVGQSLAVCLPGPPPAGRGGLLSSDRRLRGRLRRGEWPGPVSQRGGAPGQHPLRVPGAPGPSRAPASPHSACRGRAWAPLSSRPGLHRGPAPVVPPRLWDERQEVPPGCLCPPAPDGRPRPGAEEPRAQHQAPVRLGGPLREPGLGRAPDPQLLQVPRPGAGAPGGGPCTGRGGRGLPACTLGPSPCRRAVTFPVGLGPPWLLLCRATPRWQPQPAQHVAQRPLRPAEASGLASRGPPGVCALCPHAQSGVPEPAARVLATGGLSSVPAHRGGQDPGASRSPDLRAWGPRAGAGAAVCPLRASLPQRDRDPVLGGAGLRGRPRRKPTEPWAALPPWEPPPCHRPQWGWPSGCSVCVSVHFPPGPTRPSTRPPDCFLRAAESPCPQARGPAPG